MGSRQVTLAERVGVIEIVALHPAQSALPKVLQPDREAFEAAVREVTQVMEALQRVRAACEIQQKSFGKDELVTKKN